VQVIDNKEIKDIYAILETVCDPEVPVLTILDLGVVRNVEINEGEVTITITPTYTGCPAMGMIEMNIKAAMEEAGFANTKIKMVLAPAWTTDWLSEAGKQKLKAYGIAPPQTKARIETLLEDVDVNCPLCDSNNTTKISDFGSTACKALYKCDSCLEPFDYFKCH